MSCHFGSCTNKTAFIVTFYSIAVYGYDVFISSRCFVTSKHHQMSLSDNLPARNAVNTQTNNPLLMTLESAGSFIRES